jgi:hypothetical protein
MRRGPFHRYVIHPIGDHVLAFPSRAVNISSDQDMCAGTMRGTKEFVDIALAIAVMDASSRIIEKPRGLLEVLHPPDAPLLLNGYPWRADLLLKRSRSLEFLARPEFDGGKIRRPTLTCDCKARVRQCAANRNETVGAWLVTAAIYTLRNPDGL